MDSETNKWLPYNPTEGKGNSTNIVDPQTWVSSETPTVELPQIEVIAEKPKIQIF